MKRALAYSETRRSHGLDHLRSIYVSTYGIVFMATPHHGIKNQALSLFYSDKTSAPNLFMISLLDDLSSEMLQEVTTQFVPIMKHFFIFHVWEQKKTRSGEIETVIVDEASAAPTIDGESERYGIPRSHSEMVKFSNVDDPGYVVLLATLKRYIKDAPKFIRSRWSAEPKLLEIERLQDIREMGYSPSMRQISEPPSPPIPATPMSSASINQYYLAPEPTRNFIGRTWHASFIRDSLGIPPANDSRAHLRVFVIYGMGGSGKTELALKYASDNRERYCCIKSGPVFE